MRMEGGERLCILDSRTQPENHFKGRVEEEKECQGIKDGPESVQSRREGVLEE